MPFHGCIVVIKRSGADGSTFPLVNEVRMKGTRDGWRILIILIAGVFVGPCGRMRYQDSAPNS